MVGDLDRSSDHYAPRFRPIAAGWSHLVQLHSQGIASAVEERQEIDNPYVIGVPFPSPKSCLLDAAISVGGLSSFSWIGDVPRYCFYGQRRMGKTSLLNNLGRLLPSTVVPLFVDLQGPASSASDHAGLLYNLARSMVESARKTRSLSLPSLSREAIDADPFTGFDEWLDQVEAALGSRTALWTLDEFEALAVALQRGRFDAVAVLGMLRHVVQHRQRIKVMLASSHTLGELAEWSSYFINVQVVQVGTCRPATSRSSSNSPPQTLPCATNRKPARRSMR